jgi:hypothetical protein
MLAVTDNVRDAAAAGIRKGRATVVTIAVARDQKVEYDVTWISWSSLLPLRSNGEER